MSVRTCAALTFGHNVCGICLFSCSFREGNRCGCDCHRDELPRLCSFCGHGGVLLRSADAKAAICGECAKLGRAQLVESR